MRASTGYVGALARAGKFVVRNCRRITEGVLGRPFRNGLIAFGSWPLLPTAIQHAEQGIGAAILGVAILGGGRQSLPSLGSVVKFRVRVFRVRRRFRKVIGRNAAISKPISALDTIGNPTKVPGGKDVPSLMRFGRFYRGRYVPLGPRRTPFGMIVTVDGSSVGAVVTAFASESAVIGGSFGALQVETRANHPFPHLTDMSITFQDPFKKTIPFRSLPAPTLANHVVVGLDRNHHAIEQSLWLPHLAVGESGSGKSSWAHVVIAGALAQNIPLRLWVFDPKTGVEFWEYEQAAYRYTRSPYLWVEMLRELIEMMQWKLDRIRGHRRFVDIMDPEFGLDMLIIDELLAIPNFVDDNDKLNRIKVMVEGRARLLKPSQAMSHMLSQQRAAGMTTTALSQVGDKAQLKNGLRDMFPKKTVFRVASDEVATMLGYKASTYPAHELPQGQENSGRGFCETPRGKSSFRAAFLTDAERLGVAQEVERWSIYYRSLEGRLSESEAKAHAYQTRNQVPA
jgi:FtsK/SpoIIIE family